MSDYVSYDDMCSIQNLTEEAILSNLSNRFKEDQIFTFIGPILLAVNPYKIIPQSFKQQLFQRIIQDTLRGTLKEFPHIYVLAARAFLAMSNSQQSKQSIIISGQSGAGKTESTKYCMQILTKLSKKKTHSIQDKILACNPLLQAFGNSKTVRNQNSSRFGKYVQIFFGRDYSIKGAKIQSYLLQKSRVSMVQKNQRNFHIFYALTASGILGAKPAKEYSYLNKSECFTANNINDKQFLQKVLTSFNSIGFTESEQQNIWKYLLAILQLGNLEFDDKKYTNDPNNNPCQIVNNASYEFLFQVLQISQPIFQTLLLKRNSGGFKNNATKMDCEVNRDTLAKAIYNCLFQTIIDKIEIVLSPNNQQDNYEPISHQINLLDIFGFENFQKNSLEQICINFANQKLLSQYNQKIFQNQLKILRQDGLQQQAKGISQPNNYEVIGSIRNIFNIINQSTKQRFYNETNMIAAIKKQYEKKPNSIIQFKKTNQNLFILKHSPCTVSYSIEGFKLKNQDQLTPQISDVCARLFPYSSILQINKKVKKDDKTIISKFNQKIQQLVGKLSETSNHFVRCIKPNDKKRPQYVDAQYMTTQIRYLGVFETIKIRQTTFPYRKTYEDFANKYKQIVSQAKGKTHREATRIIISKMQVAQDFYLFGNNRMYMNKQLHQKLEKLHQAYMSKKIEKIRFIQRRYRAIHAKIVLRTTVQQIVKRNKADKKRKRLVKFGNICFDWLSKIAEDRLFMSFRYIEIQNHTNKHQQTTEHSSIPVPLVNSQGTHVLMRQQRTQIMQGKQPTSQSTLLIRRKAYQFSINQNSIQNAKEQLYQHIQQIQAKLANKQEQIQIQKNRRQEYIKQIQITLKKQIQRLSQSLLEKQIQNNTISEQLSKLNQQLIKSTLNLSQAKTLLSDKQFQLQMLQSQKQQLQQQKQFHKSHLSQKLKLIQQLKAQSCLKVEQGVKQYKAKYSKLEQEHKLKQKNLQEQRSSVHSLNQKNKTYQAIIKEYQNMIIKYKQQQQSFFKQKEAFHKQILQKCSIIEELRHKQPKSQSIKNDQIKKLQQKVIQLENKLSQNFAANRNSIKILQSEFTNQLCLDHMNAKIQQLQHNLKQAKIKIVALELNQKKLTSKISQIAQRNLKETADYNNKINMANQKFKTDKFTIDQLRRHITELKSQLKVNKMTIAQLQMIQKQKQVQNAEQLQISEKQLINFIKHYKKSLSCIERCSLKQEIVRTIDQI